MRGQSTTRGYLTTTSRYLVDVGPISAIPSDVNAALPTALATVQVPTRPPETTMTSPNTNLDLNFILQ